MLSELAGPDRRLVGGPDGGRHPTSVYGPTERVSLSGGPCHWPARHCDAGVRVTSRATQVRVGKTRDRPTGPRDDRPPAAGRGSLIQTALDGRLVTVPRRRRRAKPPLRL